MKKPKVGQTVEYLTSGEWRPAGVVTMVEDNNITHYQREDGSFNCFIWHFPDGPNILHRWF
jgi:hypothetical protein